MQGVAADLAAMYGGAEGKYPEGWVEFFKNTDKLLAQGLYEHAAHAAVNVLKALTWSGDAVALKSVAHRYAYADVTMFIRNFGSYTSDIVPLSSGIKNMGEAVADKLLLSTDKMKCLKCSAAGHVNSMCFSQSKKPFRANARGEEKREDERNFRDRRPSHSRDRFARR